jgi:hypothetical protein
MLLVPSNGIFTAAENSFFESLPPLEHLGGVIWAVFFGNLSLRVSI